VRSNQYKPCATTNSHRWFEESASKLGAEHFDKKYGSGAPGYQKNNPNYFNKKNFYTGGWTSYTNPQTGSHEQEPHPIDNKHISFWDFIPFL